MTFSSLPSLSNFSSPFYCSPCDRRFMDGAALEQHLRHSRFHNLCPVCGENFQNPDKRNKHLEEEHDLLACRMGHCPATFASKVQQREHWEREHVHCKQCGCTFPSMDALNTHQRTTHNPIPPPPPPPQLPAISGPSFFGQAPPQDQPVAQQAPRSPAYSPPPASQTPPASSAPQRISLPLDRPQITPAVPTLLQFQGFRVLGPTPLAYQPQSLWAVPISNSQPPPQPQPPRIVFSTPQPTPYTPPQPPPHPNPTVGVNGPSSFTCICGTSHATATALLSHLESDLCETLPSHLLYHTLLLLDYTTELSDLRCAFLTDLPKTVDGWIDYALGCSRTADGKKFACWCCNGEFEYQLVFITHFWGARVEVGGGLFGCAKCGRRFDGPVGLVRHRETVCMGEVPRKAWNLE